MTHRARASTNPGRAISCGSPVTKSQLPGSPWRLDHSEFRKKSKNGISACSVSASSFEMALIAV